MRDHQHFEKTVLANGITLYTYRDAFPICCMEIQLPVGIAHSVPANGFIPGSAHFMEHSQLIRCASFPEPYSSDRALGILGGNSNAATQLTHTTHWIDTPLGEQGFGSSLLVDRVFNSIFDEEDLAIERSVVANERGQNKYYPGKSKTSQYYFKEFINDEYCPADQVFGNDENLASLTVEKLQRMHGRVTGSEGISALAVGDDDFSSLKRELEVLETKPTSFVSKTSSTSWEHKEYHEAYFDTVPQPKLEIAWVHPRLPYAEYRAVCFMINLLVNSTQGPLYREFREERGWTYGLDAICTMRERNLIVGLTFPVNEESQISFIRDCIHDRIRKAAEDQQLAEDEVRRQRGIRVYSYQTAGSIISAASSSLITHGQIYTEADQDSTLDAMIDPAWRTYIVEKYFNPEDMGSMCFLPERRGGR